MLFERIGQMLIESSVDIGNMIIDGFILRDPGNYKRCNRYFRIGKCYFKKNTITYQSNY